MKKDEKSAMTKNIETKTNANSQVSKETTKKMSEKNLLKAKDEQEKEAQEKERQERINRAKKVNALYSPMEKAFDEMQKEIENSEVKEVGKKFEEMGNEELNFSCATGEELINNNITEVPMLISPLFHQVGMASIFGSSDVGKSSLARLICILVVLGYNIEGFEVKAIFNRAIYVSLEDDLQAISPLFKKQVKALGLKASQLKAIDFIFYSDNIIDELDQRLTKDPADLVVIDPYSQVCSKDMYKANEVRDVLGEYQRLAIKHRCLIIFIHHTRKTGESLNPSKNNALGSQAFEAYLRLLIEVKSNINNPHKKHVCVVKGNYVPTEFKRDSFDFEFTDDLIYKSLGTRTPFDRLDIPESKICDLKQEYDKINEMKEKGMSLRDIAKEFRVSHSAISKKIASYEKKFKSKQVEIEIENGNE